MADKIIITTDGGSKTIENINPAARHATLAQFGEKIADLTTNTYQKTDRVTKVNCDTEPGGGTKPTPTLTLSANSIALADVPGIGGGGYQLTVTTNSDGHLYARQTANWNGQVEIYDDQNGFRIAKDGTLTIVAQTIYIGVTETDSYKGVEVPFEITA